VRAWAPVRSLSIRPLGGARVDHRRLRGQPVDTIEI